MPLECRRGAPGGIVAAVHDRRQRGRARRGVRRGRMGGEPRRRGVGGAIEERRREVERQHLEGLERARVRAGLGAPTRGQSAVLLLQRERFGECRLADVREAGVVVDAVGEQERARLEQQPRGVPALGGTFFFRASDPAMARVGMASQ